MYDPEYRRVCTEGSTEYRRDLDEEALLSGTILLDEEMEVVSGGRTTGEEIPSYR